MASIKIRDFMNGRFFEIPKYQRGFAWNEIQITDLFDDIAESIESKSNHYIGTIVLSKSDEDEKFYVVDGQQRITTLTLIINELIKGLTEKDANYYERFYLSEDECYRLTPLNRDKDFFTNLLEGKFSDVKNKSQELMKEAYIQIGLKVSQIPDKLKYLRSLEKLEVMEFIEKSEGDAIRIFQTVNDRGKPLSNMDKAKSLLIYFSNRYLDKKLDDKISECFSDIFELYDDIDHLGKKLGINLITNKEFTEDNLMRYHFISFSNSNYEATAASVLMYLKTTLRNLRTNAGHQNYENIEEFINSYIYSLKDFFTYCKQVIKKADTDAKYYKLFVLLNLSATLYPLIVKLEQMELLEKNLSAKNRKAFTFFDLIELIEVRVYKIRGTDPKADIARLVFNIENKKPEEIEDFLIWFNQRWMQREEFQARLNSNIYPNRALNHIFVDYCEHLEKKKFKIEDLIQLTATVPTIEHILAQTPTFAPRSLNFRNKEDFAEYEHNLGNLTIIEKSLNSIVNNKNAPDKASTYWTSLFYMTKKVASEIETNKAFTKAEVEKRTKEITAYCAERWWCDSAISQPITENVQDSDEND